MQEDAIPNLLADEHSNVSLIISSLVDRGFEHEYFWINDESYSRLTKPHHKSWLTRNARLSYPMTNPAVSYVCKNKSISYKYAQRLDVTVPFTYCIDAENILNENKMKDMLDQFKKLVVKPADLAQSNGLTLDITTPQHLAKAINYAKEFSDAVLIQEQVSGDEARFVVFKGEVRAVLLRQTPRLRGDGTSTVEQLFAVENNERESIQNTAVTYPLLSERLLRHHNPRQILQKNEILELSRSTLIRSGASVYDIKSAIDSSYVSIAENLAQHLGADFIVIDLMMQDYKSIATKDNYSLIEFNELPSLKLCYSCRDGKHYDILSDLIPLIEQTLKH